MSSLVNAQLTKATITLPPVPTPPQLKLELYRYAQLAEGNVLHFCSSLELLFFDGVHVSVTYPAFPLLPVSQESSEYTITVVPARCLRGLKREEVFRIRPGTCGPRARFYKNMMPDIPLALSQPCGRFFHEEDFEFEFLREGKCPFSRVKDMGDYGSC